MTEMTKYLRTVPYVHQEEAFGRQKDKAVHALFLEQGLGKTIVTLATAARLHAMGKIDRLLVVAPCGVHTCWEREAERHLADGVKRTCHVWRGGLTKKGLEDLRRSCRGDALTILTVNVEALSTSVKAKELVRSFVDDRTMMVVDESSDVKNPSAKRTKFVVATGKRCSYRRILNGTPINQSPFDLYSQFMFLDPKILGFTSYHHFKHRYGAFVTEEARRADRRWSYERLIEYRRLPELASLIAPASTRMRKEDCLDLPEKIYVTIPVELTPEQRKIYKTMDRDGVAEFDSFEVLSPLRITRLTKMQQIVGGFILDEEARPRLLPGRNPKLEALTSVIEHYPGKIVLSARFTHEINLMKTVLEDHGGVVEYHGSVGAKDREEAVRRFQDDPEVRFLVGQERALIGITLTAAETMVYWSNEFSYRARYQSEDRLHRIGQRKNVVYVDLIGEKTVDERVVEVLKNCRELADRVVDGPEMRA